MRKNILTYLFEMPIFAMAGIGLVQLVHSVLSNADTISGYLLGAGGVLGLLIWKMESDSIKQLAKLNSTRVRNFYIYLTTAIVYMVALTGILEVIYFFSGEVRLDSKDLISWQGVIVLLPYIGAWIHSVDTFKKGAREIKANTDS